MESDTERVYYRERKTARETDRQTYIATEMDMLKAERRVEIHDIKNINRQTGTFVIDKK
jgi:hypothetical protein